MFKMVEINFLKINIGPEVTFPSLIGRKEAERGFTIPWQPTLQDRAKESALLSWKSRLSKFSGRQTEFEELSRWANDNYPVSVKFISGKGGVGKTRLAVEFAEEIKKRGWDAGRVEFIEGQQSFPDLGSKKDTLLLVDYPEENRNAVSKLLTKLASLQPKNRIRVLFLTRLKIEDWEQIFIDCRADAIINMRPIQLGRLDDEASWRVYVTALEAAAKFYGTIPLPLSLKQITAWINLQQENYRAVFLVALAVYSAQNPDEEAAQFNSYKLVKAFAQQEIGHLHRLSEKLGLINVDALPRLVAMAAVAGFIPIHRIEEIVDQNNIQLGFPPIADVEAILRQSMLLQDNALHGPQPDLIASVFCALVFAQREDTAPELIWSALIDDPAGSLVRLSRLSYDAEVILGNTHIRLCEKLATAIDKKPQRCRILDPVILDTLPSWGLNKVGMAIYRTLLNIECDEVKRAHYHYCFANRLQESDEIVKAVEEISSSVKIYRNLVQSGSTNYESALAISLNNMSINLREIGKFAESLQVSNESVEIYRRLAKADPERFNPSLAFSLHQLSNCLAGLDQKAEALIVSQEVVSIRRYLVGINPTVYLHLLADDLINLSDDLSSAGDHTGSLNAIDEAVNIFEDLANQNPERYEGDYALSLSNHAARLLEAGNFNKSLLKIEEGIKIYKRLFQANSEKYGRFFAANFMIKGAALHYLGHSPNEVISAFKEGADFIRPYVIQYPQSWFGVAFAGIEKIINLLSQMPQSQFAEILSALRGSLQRPKDESDQI